MAAAIIASLGHPDEIAALVRYKFVTRKQVKIAPNDRAKIRCYEFLDETSRSFAAVIRNLDDELRDPVCIFYLVLRGLDTIEDDMTIPVERKVVLLRQFYQIICQKGWTFNESGPEEKDRQLLIEFDVVIDVLLRLERKFQDVITDICKRMGHGMAEYVSNAKLHTYGVITNDDFDEYCHYVAGLVGHGLSNLFAASGLEDPSIAHETRLANSMGLFLQKVNIIRDYLDDVQKKRHFWPRQIWSQYADDLIDLKAPGNEGRALDCLTAMIVNALQHAPDCLSYIYRLRNRSVLAFCAIPQVMAIATLAVLFRNYHVFEGVVKIRRGEAVLLIERCKSIQEVADIFRQYARQIICKNIARDPNFMKISIACGQIEQWCQTNLSSLDSQTDLPSNTNLYFLLVFLLAPLVAYYISSTPTAELKQQG